MKISVITVCYNAAAHIEGCLRSVAEQTHADVEHIVIDGLSRDGTVDTVRRYPHVTRLVSERDRGIYDAMNKGLDLVSGDYVLFLNADDRFASPAALAKAVAAIRSDPGGDVYYGSLEVRSLDGTSSVFHPPPPEEAPSLMICGCLPHQSTLARPSVFSKTGRFDLRYRYHADYDWFLKVLADCMVDVRNMQVVVGSFLMGGASSQLAKGQPEVFAIQNGSPLYASAEWDKKRIAALQEALLGERLAAARLQAEILVQSVIMGIQLERLMGSGVAIQIRSLTVPGGSSPAEPRSPVNSLATPPIGGCGCREAGRIGRGGGCSERASDTCRLASSTVCVTCGLGSFWRSEHDADRTTEPFPWSLAETECFMAKCCQARP